MVFNLEKEEANGKNTSDSIEEYIKQLLAQSGIAEIKRSNLADAFQVVPSQINYVIKTRFTESRGYIVESKRGGGGYIRIARVSFSDQHQMFDNLMGSIGECISEQVFTDLIQLLFDEKIISEREGNLILATASDEVLGKDAPEIRARMLRKILQRLDRKGFHL
ncbi:Transcriptional regulator CtsR [Streptococcus sp. HSISB1]|nr:Transcriptional regulator CtsR [Streptococcus sp. HSISB1]